jgi:hypothetical protein
MFTAMIPGGLTVTPVLALSEPNTAVTVVVPCPTVLRTPGLSMVPTAVFEELHVVCFVTSATVPSCSCAVARKGWGSPSKTLGLAGTMDRDSGVFVPGVLLIVQADRDKQTSKSESQAHLEQLDIYFPSPGPGKCYPPREKRCKSFPKQENGLPPRIRGIIPSEKHR